MSERDLDADLKANSQKAEFRYVIFVELAFDSGTVRAHNSVGTLSFGGNDYLGVGALGSIEPIQESIQLVDNPVTLALSPVDEGILTAVRDEDIYGRAADIYLGALDENGELTGTPTNWLSGYIDYPSAKVGVEDGIAITIQTRAAKLKKRNNKRYTLEQHQKDYPGDRFMEFLPYVKEVEVPWGGEKVRTGFVSGDGITGTDNVITGAGTRNPLGKGIGL